MTQEIVFHDFLSASFEILQYDGRQQIDQINDSQFEHERLQ